MAQGALGEESAPDLARYIAIPPVHPPDLAIEHHFQRPFGALRTHTAHAAHTRARKQLGTLWQQINNIVETVASGRASPALLDRLEQLEEEKNRLETDLTSSQPDPVRIHPNAAELYAAKINNLRESLSHEGDREEADTILRS